MESFILNYFLNFFKFNDKLSKIDYIHIFFFISFFLYFQYNFINYLFKIYQIADSIFLNKITNFKKIKLIYTLSLYQ